jgi:hypothetical protein
VLAMHITLHFISVTKQYVKLYPVFEIKQMWGSFSKQNLYSYTDLDIKPKHRSYISFNLVFRKEEIWMILNYGGNKAETCGVKFQIMGKA